MGHIRLGKGPYPYNTICPQCSKESDPKEHLQPVYIPCWPDLGEIPPLILFPTKFHFVFIWKPSKPEISGDRAGNFPYKRNDAGWLAYKRDE
jgi:hypothetical protein